MPHNYREFSEVSTHKADYKRFVFGLFVSAVVHLNPGLWFIFYLQVCTEKYMQIHFLGFFLLLFFHCEGICGNSLHSYKHQCIFWLSSLLVVVCTFQAEQLFVAGHRYNKMCFSQVYLPARQLFVLGQRQIEKCFPQSTVIFSCGPQRWM